MNNSRGVSRLGLAPRAEILACPQKSLAQRVAKVCSRWQLKRDKKLLFLSLPCAHLMLTASLLLLQGTLARPRFDNSAFLISKGSVVVVERKKEQLNDHWDGAGASQAAQPGEGKVLGSF